MSHDPSLQPPPLSHRSPIIFNGAARAGWLMLAIGIMMLLGGGCFVACGLILPTVQLPPEQAKNIHQLETQFHGSFTMLIVTMGCIVAAAGIYHLVISFFVRRGKRGAIYTSIVTSFLAIGWCGVNILGGLLFSPANAAASVCFLTVAGGIFVWMILWLFQALRGATSTAAAAQYQAQYWQMLQMQQAYGLPPNAAVPPPPVGVFVPPSPPQPPSPEQTGWAYGQQTSPPPPPPPSD